MTPVITPYNGESLEVINDFILQSKASWGYSQALLNLWRSGLEVSAQDVLSRHFFFGRSDERLVLIYSLSELSSPSCELEDCWIHPDFIGKGLGASIFCDIEKRMLQLGWTSMKIVSDPNAAGFYKRMGAVQAGEAQGKPEGRVLPIFEWRPKSAV